MLCPRRSLQSDAHVVEGHRRFVTVRGCDRDTSGSGGPRGRKIGFREVHGVPIDGDGVRNDGRVHAATAVAASNRGRARRARRDFRRRRTRAGHG